MSEPMARILVVEDDPDMLEILRFQLEREGYRVEAAMDGAQAIEAARRNLPDLVVLDLMLPRMTGLQVCQRLRSDRATRDVLVLMLTARGEEMDRIVGFEMGADDYVLKPFSVRELLLRIEALLRRRRPKGPERIRNGPLEVDTASHEVSVAGTSVSLSPLEFRLLLALCTARGRVQSRETLLETVWGYSEEVRSRTVDTHVRRLREKLGPAGELIETVRGFGYRMGEPS